MLVILRSYIRVIFYEGWFMPFPSYDSPILQHESFKYHFCNIWLSEYTLPQS